MILYDGLPQEYINLNHDVSNSTKLKRIILDIFIRNVNVIYHFKVRMIYLTLNTCLFKINSF